MTFIVPEYRQSNYDLCLQAIGSFDGLVKFCKNNNIENIDVSKKENYVYDENDVINKNFIGVKYATNNNL